jgi:hypothetical protein
MPTVPTYTTPSVEPQALPTVRDQVPYHLSSYAGQGGRETASLGAGLVRAGDEMMAEATRRQIGLNEAAVKDYDSRLMGAIQGVLYGTPDNPDNGYMAFKGKNAVDAFDVTSSKLQGWAPSWARTCKTPRSRNWPSSTPPCARKRRSCKRRSTATSKTWSTKKRPATCA